MNKCVTLVILMTCIVFAAQGVRPAFDFGAGWSYVKLSDFDGSHFLDLGIGTTVPFCSYIGLQAGIFGISFDLSEEGTILGLSSRIGLIEMIPTRYASPYFRQAIILDHLTSGGSSITDFGVGVGVGVEFMSESYVSPHLGGYFKYSSVDVFGISGSSITVGAELGVRFSWVK